MNRLMIGLVVGLGTFAIAEASKVLENLEDLDAKKAKAEADAKQKAKQKAAAAEKKMADAIASQIRKDLEQTALELKALEDKYIVSKSKAEERCVELEVFL